jgi:hypothetical protein
VSAPPSPPSPVEIRAALTHLTATNPTVREHAEEVLFGVLDQLSDDDDLRILDAAVHDGATNDTVMAQLLRAVDLDRLGHADDLLAVALAQPGSEFQDVLLEGMRDELPGSRARVKLLRKLATSGGARARKHAVIGLAAKRELPDETCAALAAAIHMGAPPLATYAELRVASLACGAARESALHDLAARVASGPLPVDPHDLEYLCASELDTDVQRASIAVLRQIARSRIQPMPVRAGAMDAAYLCDPDWDTLKAELRKDPDPAVDDAAGAAEAIEIYF